MTPYDFCHWLKGYLAAEPLGVSQNVFDEFEKVDLSPMVIFMPPPIDDSGGAPSNPSKREYYATINGYPIPAPVIQTPLN